MYVILLLVVLFLLVGAWSGRLPLVITLTRVP